jgi:hypothetical protein
MACAPGIPPLRQHAGSRDPTIKPIRGIYSSWRQADAPRRNRRAGIAVATFFAEIE